MSLLVEKAIFKEKAIPLTASTRQTLQPVPKFYRASGSLHTHTQNIYYGLGKRFLCCYGRLKSDEDHFRGGCRRLWFQGQESLAVTQTATQTVVAVGIWEKKTEYMHHKFTTEMGLSAG